jgi:ATP-dependent Lon protease
VALISALTDIPTRADVAMTGEITLRGRVLGVGGIKEKAVAALQGRIKRVLLPATNAGELERLPEEVLQGVEFLLVQNMDEVLEGALVTSPAGRTDAAANELMDGAQSAGIQLSQ